MEGWAAELVSGRPDAAWDAFVERYRRLIFAAIRHYAQDYDDVMDVFARVCEALREDDLARLRCYAEQPSHTARFSTWLVTVVRHLTIDWFRHRDGRRRLSALAERLPPLRRRIFELVFFDGRSSVEAYEMIRASDAPDLPFGRFLTELRETHRAATAGRRGRVLRELGPPPAPEPQRGTTGVTAERSDRLTKALASLGTEERRAVELYVMDGRPAAFSASRIRRPSTAGYTAHSARCGEAWSRPAFTQETCSNPPAAVRLKERAETSTLPTRTLRRLQARRVHEVRIRTRRAAARARPGQLPRRLDQRAQPTGPPRSARFAA